MGKNYNSSRLVNGLFVDASGNVAIGNTSPSGILDVQKSQNATTNFYFRNTNTTDTNSRCYVNIVSGSVILQLKAINGDNVYISPTTAVTTYLGYNNLFSINSSGGVNIQPGTYTRIQTYFSGAYTSGWQFSDLLGGIWHNAAVDQLNIHSNAAGGYITMTTNSSERLRVLPNGNVLIGTTTDSGIQLKVNNAAYVRQYLGFGLTDSDRYIGQGNQVSGAFQSYDFVMSNFTADNNRRVIITNYSTGVYLASGSSSWSTFSDERLKDVYGNIDNAAEKLCKIRAIDYSWKSDKSKKHNLGLIAQDVEKVFPQIIDKSKSFDENDETEYLSVKYTELIPVLVAAIQELKAELDELKANKI